ncbi:MAG TPA: sulfatase-like hydrolase/transferase [Oligoflexia bacterium]|nr:sulfatase-like hydrolase/transferase [Oligoflexia bacterium]
MNTVDAWSKKPSLPGQRIAAALLVAFWGLELFFIEQYAASPSTMSTTFRTVCRLVAEHTTLFFLHFIAASIALLVLPKRLLCLLFFVNALFFVTIIEYGEAFHRPLPWWIIVRQTQDLLGVLTPDLSWFNETSLIVVALGLLIKIVLLRCFSISVLLSGKQRVWAAVFLCLVWAAPLVRGCLLLRLHRSPSERNRSLLMEAMAPAMGYLTVWCLDALTTGNEELLRDALAQKDTGRSRLIGVEAPFPVAPQIAAIQIESFDWEALHRLHQGREVMPGLRALSRQAMLYKIMALHHNGTVDMDFAFLMRRKPSRHIVNYRIIGFPYQNSTVELLKQRGYEAVALHNHGGAFFNRRYAFAQMGFDALIFSAEMRSLYPEETKESIPDELVFRASAEKFRQAPGAQFQMIITMTSHAPFQQYPPGAGDFIATPRTREEFFCNSMNYVDREFQRYLAQLPEAALLIIWGDHSWNRRAHYREETQPEAEYVPFLIYQKGTDLGLRQRTKDSGLALSGELDFLEVSRFVYAVLAAKVSTEQGLKAISLHQTD